MTMEVQFSMEMEKARLVAERYEQFMLTRTEARALPGGYKRQDLMMDLTAADGVNGNDPLDWDRLIYGDTFNFLHDVLGIRNHINRETGRIERFSPRCTRKHTPQEREAWWVNHVKESGLTAEEALAALNLRLDAGTERPGDPDIGRGQSPADWIEHGWRDLG